MVEYVILDGIFLIFIFGLPPFINTLLQEYFGGGRYSRKINKDLDDETRATYFN
jgi:hypothetical protein